MRSGMQYPTMAFLGALASLIHQTNAFSEQSDEATVYHRLPFLIASVGLAYAGYQLGTWLSDLPKPSPLMNKIDKFMITLTSDFTDSSKMAASLKDIHKIIEKVSELVKYEVISPETSKACIGIINKMNKAVQKKQFSKLYAGCFDLRERLLPFDAIIRDFSQDQKITAFFERPRVLIDSPNRTTHALTPLSPCNVPPTPCL